MRYHHDFVAIFKERFLKTVKGPIVDPLQRAVRKQLHFACPLIEFGPRDSPLQFDELDEFRVRFVQSFESYRPR